MVTFNPKSLIGTTMQYGEILNEPRWQAETRTWRALVAVTPNGPLVLAEFKITVEGKEEETNAN